MRPAQLRCLRPQHFLNARAVRRNSTLPIVKLDGATFYRQYPSDAADANAPPNPPIFPNLSFSLPSEDEHWSIVSPASLARTTFLQVLNGQYICVPPNARSYPYLSSADLHEARLRSPQNAISYIGFDAERGGLGGTSLKGAYLSARYEARIEETDWSLQDYLEGNTELNALEKDAGDIDQSLLERVVTDLRLEELLGRPVSNLSNGQTRRARIAKSLLRKPELLLLDGPFMGLDPPTVRMISELLRDMADKRAPRLVLSLRPEDRVPHWISHLVYVDSSLNVLAQGTKQQVLDTVWSPQTGFAEIAATADKTSDVSKPVKKRKLGSASDGLLTRDGFPKHDPSRAPGDAIVQMQGVKVSYGSQDDKAYRTVLGDWSQDINGEEAEGLHWDVHRGQRWGIFGPNGSGKTTLLSLITSDHPQTYSLPIRLFGKSRLPSPGEPGISLFELQSRMGHSSPEVHTFFPKNLTVRRVLESAWADAPLSKPKLTHQADRRVDACLRWFAGELSPDGKSEIDEILTVLAAGAFKTGRYRPASAKEARARVERLSRSADDLDWADSLHFRELSFSGQRLALFLRAIVAQPDLVILDEAFSGIDEATRDKCLRYLSHGERKIAGARKGDEGERPSLKDSPVAQYGEVVFEGLSDQQALLVISHSKEDVPGCIREWMCLPEAGEGKSARWGSLAGPLELNPQGWDEIWGLSK
ncbi:hypothetical protein MBLNU459_g1907t1 [Dothideomycetes sp. NU459]